MRKLPRTLGNPRSFSLFSTVSNRKTEPINLRRPMASLPNHCRISFVTRPRKYETRRQLPIHQRSPSSRTHHSFRFGTAPWRKFEGSSFNPLPSPAHWIHCQLSSYENSWTSCFHSSTSCVTSLCSTVCSLSLKNRPSSHRSSKSTTSIPTTSGITARYQT